MKLYVAMIGGSDCEAEDSVYGVYDDLQLAKERLSAAVYSQNNKFSDKGWIEEFTLNQPCRDIIWHNIK